MDWNNFKSYSPATLNSHNLKKKEEHQLEKWQKKTEEMEEIIREKELKVGKLKKPGPWLWGWYEPTDRWASCPLLDW